MKKGLLQLAISVAIGAAAWYGLSTLPFVKWLHVEEARRKSATNMSKLLLQAYLQDKPEFKNDSIPELADVLKLRLCRANGLDTGLIHLHIVHDDVMNAFTLPGGHIVINDELILFCDNPDMLAGVLGHEVGHVLHDHITSKFAREIGITAVSSLGGEGGRVIRELLRKAVTTSFDRDQEREADTTSVRLMLNAQIDPAPTAAFMNKVKDRYGNTPDWLLWVSTHPASSERAAEIVRLRPEGRTFTPSMDEADWKRLQQKLKAKNF